MSSPQIRRPQGSVSCRCSDSRRYLHTDGVLGGARASPAVKAATLHRDSAALAATVRQQLDDRLAASPDPPEVHDRCGYS